MSFYLIQDCFTRCLERKRTFILFGIIYLVGIVLGICFVKTPSVYDYHLNICERYMARVCFSSRSVFAIFIERVCGTFILLALMLIAGIHFAALAVPPAVLLYRAYTFGGSLTIFFSVYRVTGVLVVFVLYLPIHLLIDILLIAATVVSCGRAHRFQFCKSDFCALGLDLIAFSLLIATVCLLETVILLAVFHPIGYTI